MNNMEKYKSPLTDRERKQLQVSQDYIRFRGGWFKYKCAESTLIQYIYYGLKMDVIMNRFSSGWKSAAESVCKQYLSPEEYADKALVAKVKNHMFHCYRLAKLKPGEYFQYNLRHKSDEEIKSYISDSSMMELLSKTGARKLHNVELNEKCNFYKIASPWFKRKVVTIESRDDYMSFLNLVRDLGKVIVKPASVGCGDGIFLLEYSNDSDIKNVFDEMMSKGHSYIVEELIQQGEEMASWNPSSVNTVRINTFKNKKGVFEHICFMRVGRSGSFVDNGGKGGIFTCIDSKTGKIDTDGYGENQYIYTAHPDSNIVFKGWQIPNWDELLNLAKDLHRDVFPKHPYIGWDFAQSKDGWVLVEGNWGQFVCQQTCYDRGIKQEIVQLLKG